jgi:hypothetical protein
MFSHWVIQKGMLDGNFTAKWRKSIDVSPLGLERQSSQDWSVKACFDRQSKLCFSQRRTEFAILAVLRFIVKAIA